MIDYEKLRKDVPQIYRSLVDRTEAGSRAAAVKLHCLQCVGYQRAEVSRCSSAVCPLWAFRPYQSAVCDAKT